MNMGKKKPTGEGGDSHERSLAATGKSYSESRVAAIAKFLRPGSQRAIILDHLKRADGDWIGVNVLMRAAKAVAVHSQIAALRDSFGLEIKNKMKKGEDGVTLSYYRLVEFKVEAK